MTKTIIVNISGFLTPSQWVSYPESNIPSNIEMISVYPSPTGSIHDRVCQIFYELKGGTVDFGAEHSSFHNHARYGRTYKQGKFETWSEKNPIIIISHSFGGVTAWALQNYLEQRRFPGYDSNHKWVAGIIAANSPFNGALRVYNLGLNLNQPPLVTWGSQGCIISWLIHVTEYFNLTSFRKVIDFDQGWLFPFLYQTNHLYALSDIL